MEVAGAGGTPPYVRAIRARERAERLSRPTAEWGRAYLKRGTEASLAAFGASKKSANPQQLLNRQAGYYRGPGRYSFGKGLRALGGYAKSVAKVIKTGLGAARDVKEFTKGGLYGGQGVYGGQGLYGGQNSMTRHNALMDFEGAESSMTIHGQKDETDDFSLTLEEYIKPIFAPPITAGTSSSFAAQLIDINPGLQNLAPKLAAIAANYCHYELHQLVFKYKSKVNESNVNKGIAGDVMMTFNYDPANDTFDSVGDVMQSSGRIMGRIVDNLVLGVECDEGKSKDTKYFVRTCPVPIGRDVDEYDHGKLLVCTSNIPSDYSNLAIGDLYMYYTVTLKQFKPGSSKLNNQQRDVFVDSTNRTEVLLFFDASLPVTSSRLYRSALVAQQSNIGGLISSPSVRSIDYTFPADVEGYFEVILSFEGASLSATAIHSEILPGSNITNVSDMYAANHQPVPPLVGISGDLPAPNTTACGPLCCIFIGHYKVRSSTAGFNNTIRLTYNGQSGSTVSQWSLDVREISSNQWQSRSLLSPKFVNLFTGIEETP